MSAYRIASLKWDYHTRAGYECWTAKTPFGLYAVTTPNASEIEPWVDWSLYDHDTPLGRCGTIENGKRLAEQHWTDWIKQGLEEVK